MGMYERRLFLKPICKTDKDVASGVQTDSRTWTKMLTIPWDKLGYLKRIEIGRHCDRASGCAVVEIWDDFYMPITEEMTEEVSGLVPRKAITIPDGTAQVNWDETEDIPLIQNVYVVPSISGLDITLCAKLMG